MKKLASLLIALLLPQAAAALDLEDQVKAAFLLNFAKFVTWPASKVTASDDPVELCIVDDPARATAMGALLSDKLVGSRRITVSATSVPEARDCHIAFIGANGDETTTLTALEQLEGSQTLTVYETSRALDSGVIRFFLKDRKVRFEINTRAARDESLQISSKLLRVAAIRSD